MEFPDLTGQYRTLIETLRNHIRHKKTRGTDSMRDSQIIELMFNSAAGFDELLLLMEQTSSEYWLTDEINSLYGKRITEDLRFTHPERIFFGMPDCEGNYEIASYQKKGDFKRKLIGAHSDVIVGRISDYGLESAVYVYNRALYANVHGSVQETTERIRKISEAEINLPVISVVSINKRTPR